MGAGAQWFDSCVVLGWARYRAGKWQLALQAFEMSEGYSFSMVHVADLEFGLAATKWQLGQQEAALKHFRRAKEFMKPRDISDGYYVSRRLLSEIGQLLNQDYQVDTGEFAENTQVD